MQSPNWIKAKVSQFRNPQLPLFISTTHPYECRQLFITRVLQLLFRDDYKVSKSLTWTLERTVLISFTSQVVAAQTQEFVGNRFSSYTTEINNLRYLRDPRLIVCCFSNPTAGSPSLICEEPVNCSPWCEFLIQNARLFRMTAHLKKFRCN